jgi:hypothetical protein
MIDWITQIFKGTDHDLGTDHEFDTVQETPSSCSNYKGNESRNKYHLDELEFMNSVRLKEIANAKGIALPLGLSRQQIIVKIMSA